MTTGDYIFNATDNKTEMADRRAFLEVHPGRIVFITDDDGEIIRSEAVYGPFPGETVGLARTLRYKKNNRGGHKART